MALSSLQPCVSRFWRLWHSLQVCWHKRRRWADYVNTLQGTASRFELSWGNTYPTTAMPWGMHTWTPANGP